MPQPIGPARRALFLDRDGVVNVENGYVWQLEHFHILEDFYRLAQAYVALGFDLVIITNQGGIGKGLYSPADVELLHDHLRAELRARGLPQPHILCCPHHPTTSNCLCRKPHDLLFRRALALGHYKASACWMVGDRVRDIVPAHALGMRTLLIHSHPDEEIPPNTADVVVSTHAQAVAHLLEVAAHSSHERTSPENVS